MKKRSRPQEGSIRDFERTFGAVKEVHVDCWLIRGNF